VAATAAAFSNGVQVAPQSARVWKDGLSWRSHTATRALLGVIVLPSIPWSSTVKQTPPLPSPTGFLMNSVVETAASAAGTITRATSTNRTTSRFLAASSCSGKNVLQHHYAPDPTIFIPRVCPILHNASSHGDGRPASRGESRPPSCGLGVETRAVKDGERQQPHGGIRCGMGHDRFDDDREKRWS
jgi:hypothetical protein